MAFARWVGRRALRALQTLACRVAPAAPIAIGTTLVGLAVIVGLLDLFVNQPQSLDDLVLLPDLGICFGAGAALVVVFGALELHVLRHHRDALIALAVGVGLVATAAAFIVYVLTAAGILSLFGVRGGVPESLGAAWATLIGIAILVAATLFITMRYALRLIAALRHVDDDTLPVSVFAAALVVIALPLALRNPPPTEEQLRPKPPDPVLVAARNAPVAPAASSEVEFATHYRPLLYFDTKERWRPLDVDAYLREQDASGPAHELCAPSKVAWQVVGYDCRALKDQRDLARASTDPDAVLQLDAHRSDAEKLAADHAAPQRIYYHLSHDAAHVYLDYWVFYRFNDSPSNFGPLTCLSGLSISEGTCFDHEGDWEGITVTLASSSPGQPPEFVTYAGHKWRYRFDWSALSAAGSTQGFHPKVWVAQGSHASYPLPCGPGTGRACHQLNSDIPDGRRDGRFAWPANDDATCQADHCVARLPISASGGPASWDAFAGIWGMPRCTVGLRLCVRSDGPPSPYFQKRYQTPGAGTPGDGLLPRG